MKEKQFLKSNDVYLECQACNFCNPLGKKRLKKKKVDFRIDTAPKKNEIRLMFIGQPNVGKSSLLNALVGNKIVVSNYPGTSIEIIEARKEMNLYVKNQETIQEIMYYFKDTPGIYSISDRSAEETITKKSIIENDYDLIIMIADATALERSLYFTLQVMESGQNVILGLNFNEDALKKGISINTKKLSKILSIPVVKFNPMTKNVEDLIVAATIKVKNPSKKCFKVKYNDHIEELIEFISQSVEINLPRRFVSLRILEEDPDFIDILPNDQKRILDEKKKAITIDHQNIKEDISKERYGTSAYISEQVSHIVKLEKIDSFKKPITDKVLLHKIWGPIFTLLFFIGIFFVLLVVGGYIEDLLINIGDFILELIPTGVWDVGGFSYLDLLREGLAGAFAGIAIALPYVLLFYLILGFTEDIGLLPRFIVNIQKLFDYFRLPSKGFISMILGIGCSVPAYSSTRIINSKSDRIKIAFLFAFIPCSSRIGIIMGVVGFYGGVLLALMVFGTILIAMLIWTFIIKWIMKIPPEPMIIELPPYRRPIINNVFSKSWLRMKGFIKIVIPLLIAGGIIYSLLDQLGVTDYFIAPFSPILRFLFNLPGETIIPLLFGFVQKDLTGAMLISVLGKESGQLSLTLLQLYTFGVAACIGVPCIIALGMMFKEYGLKDSLFVFFSVLLYGILITSLSWRILNVLIMQ